MEADVERVLGGGWWVEGGGWMLEGGGWSEESGVLRVVASQEKAVYFWTLSKSDIDPPPPKKKRTPKQ